MRGGASQAPVAGGDSLGDSFDVVRFGGFLYCLSVARDKDGEEGEGRDGGGKEK